MVSEWVCVNPQQTLPLLIGLLTLIPFILAYWIGRAVVARRRGKCLRQSRPWQTATLEGWLSRGWLDPARLQTLPAELSPLAVFYEWAWCDPEVAGAWRVSLPPGPETPVEALVRDAWDQLPAVERHRTLTRLRKAVSNAGTWWGGAENGWNRRPLSVLATAVSKKTTGLPLLPLEDLTAAPQVGAFRVAAAVSEADGPELVLMLAALRNSSPRFSHPLAPPTDPRSSLIQGLSTQVGTDVGRRVGAGIGAMFGPLGSMLGQYLGGMAGQLGGQALAAQSVPEPVARALRETEQALSQLGQLAGTEAFARAVLLPADAILAYGQAIEEVRQKRARRVGERLWPSTGLCLAEEVLLAAAAELKAYRAAGELFTKAAVSGGATAAGGMVLQNPWLVCALPTGPERLSAVRATLNTAASALRQALSKP